MFNIFISILFLFISLYKCIDIKLSLLKKGIDPNKNSYPVIITIEEPLYTKSPIDLFILYDTCKNMENNKDNLVKALSKVVEALNENDKLCLISFCSKPKKRFGLSYMNNNGKNSALNIINNIEFKDNINYSNVIKKFIDNIIKSKAFNKERVQSIIFMINNEGYETDLENNVNKLIKSLENNEYNFNLNVFCLSSDFENPSILLKLSEVRDGTFYTVNNNLNNLTDYILNVIGSMKSTKYKYVNISINSRYNITNFYGSEHMLQYSKSDINYNISILQFITGKEYNYVFEVDLNDIKINDRILYVDINYEDFNGNFDQKTYYLKYYNSVNYFYFKKDEYCRILSMEILSDFLGHNKAYIEFKTFFKMITEYCNNDLDINIIKQLNTIKEDNKNNEIYPLYGLLSEVFFKKGGVNLWYSNQYQKELIYNYTKTEI